MRIAPKILGFLDSSEADVGCAEVAADDVRLALAAAQEAMGPVGEVVVSTGTGGVNVPFILNYQRKLEVSNHNHPRWRCNA